MLEQPLLEQSLLEQSLLEQSLLGLSLLELSLLEMPAATEAQCGGIKDSSQTFRSCHAISRRSFAWQNALMHTQVLGQLRLSVAVEVHVLCRPGTWTSVSGTSTEQTKQKVFTYVCFDSRLGSGRPGKVLHL